MSSKCLLSLFYACREKHWNSRKLTGTGILTKKKSRTDSVNTMASIISQAGLLISLTTSAKQTLSRNTWTTLIVSMTISRWQISTLSILFWTVSTTTFRKPWHIMRTYIGTYPNRIKNISTWISALRSSIKINKTTRTRVSARSVDCRNEYSWEGESQEVKRRRVSLFQKMYGINQR